jgi:arylsulfatase A-like enzyme
MRFTQFYNTARCCPTRASLLTGLYAHQAGVGHMVGDKGHPSYQGYLNDKCVTIPEAIRPAGYRALMVGKWHVGEKKGHWPMDRGFERFYGLVSGGSNYWKRDPNRIFAIDNTAADPTDAPGFYMTDAFSDSAVQYIADQAGKPEPFFLYLAYTSPHWPLHAHPQDIAKYRGKYMEGWDVLRERRRKRMIELGVLDASVPLSPRDPKARAWEDVRDKPARDLEMAVYAAQIDRMDQGIGKVIAKLKETGALENTLILFLADNGGCAEAINSGQPGVPPGPKESFKSYGLPWANASNTPFRMFKHWVHEGGISTPLIAHWPGQIAPGAITHQPGHLIDIMATCLELTGAKYPEEFNGRKITPLEGKSLVSIFNGQQHQSHQAIFWEHEGNRAVREGDWKLVALNNGAWELYDISKDRAELNNLAEKEPQRVKRMAEMYDNWAKRAGVVPWKELNQRSAPTPPPKA